MSSRWMNVLPWVGVGISIIGLVGFVLGILTLLVSGLSLAGAAIIAGSFGLILCGVVLFFAMCIVQDITGMF